MKSIICFLLMLCCSVIVCGEEIDPALLKKANAGDANAQFAIAQSIAGSDFSYNRDDARVGEWLKKAAENGHADAQYALSQVLIWKAYGIPQDVDLSYYWQKKAADNGCAEAQYREYFKYYYGSNGTKRDIQKAMEYLNKSAKQDYIFATCMLAATSMDEKNREDAIYWSKKTIDIYNNFSNRDKKDKRNKTEYDQAIEYLTRLGVTYNPSDNVAHNNTATTSSSTKNNSANQIKEALLKPDSWTVKGSDDYLTYIWNDGGSLSFKNDGSGQYTSINSIDGVYTMEFTWSVKPNNILELDGYKGGLPKQYLVESMTDDGIKLKTKAMRNGNFVIITLTPYYDDFLDW